MSGPRLTLVSALSALDNALAGGGGCLSPPVGVLTLAAVVRKNYDPSVVDMDHIWWSNNCDHARFQDRVVSAIVSTKPQLLGFGTISGSYPATLRIARECSAVLPNVPIIFGGPQASVVDVTTMRAFPFIDFVVRGEADETFPKLLEALAGGNHPGLLQGLTYRSGESIARTQNAPPVHDLDDLPIPAFDLLPYGLNDRSLPIEAGRGCPFACTFCSTNDFFRRKFRLRSPHRILTDMRILNERYGTSQFSLTHDMFTVDRKRVVDFCETMIAAGSPFEWSCSARTDCVDRDLLRLMRQAGCYDIFFGIETGSQKMQRVIEKDLDMRVVREIFQDAGTEGFRTTASIIVGYPEETPDDLSESVRFYGDMLRFQSVEPQFNILSPLAGTPLTVKYQHALFLDEDWSSISESGRGQSAADRALISAYPDIFQSFYALPSQTPRTVLRRLRDFLYAGGVRCRLLLYALHHHVGDLSVVFRDWERENGEHPEDWFYSQDFTQSLLDFAVRTYGQHLPVKVAANFYRNMFECSKPQAMDDHSHPVRLETDVRFMDCAGDIVSLIRAFRETGHPPADSILNRPVSVAVRSNQTSRGGFEVLEFPFVTTEVLRRAQDGWGAEAIVEDFESRGVALEGYRTIQVVDTAIAMLTSKGILARVGLREELPRPQLR